MKKPKAPSTTSPRIQEEWGRRVHAEYGSAAATQHFTLWLIQLGLSPDLVLEGLRIVRDELEHARLSHRVMLAAGGLSAPPLSRESLGLRRTSRPLEVDVLCACLDIFCLGETVAVPLFSAMRKHCSVPSPRRALDRILRDEVRHRDFGFAVLGSLLESVPTLRKVAQAELPQAVARLRSVYAGNGETMTEEEHNWGLLDHADYARITEKSLKRDHLPRFHKLGLSLVLGQ